MLYLEECQVGLLLLRNHKVGDVSTSQQCKNIFNAPSKVAIIENETETAWHLSSWKWHHRGTSACGSIFFRRSATKSWWPAWRAFVEKKTVWSSIAWNKYPLWTCRSHSAGNRGYNLKQGQGRSDSTGFHEKRLQWFRFFFVCEQLRNYSQFKNMLPSSMQPNAAKKLNCSIHNLFFVPKRSSFLHIRCSATPGGASLHFDLVFSQAPDTCEFHLQYSIQYTSPIVQSACKAYLS